MLSIKYKVQIAKDERGAYYNADPVSPPGCQVRFFSSVWLVENPPMLMISDDDDSPPLDADQVWTLILYLFDPVCRSIDS